MGDFWAGIFIGAVFGGCIAMVIIALLVASRCPDEPPTTDAPRRQITTPGSNWIIWN